MAMTAIQAASAALKLIADRPTSYPSSSEKAASQDQVRIKSLKIPSVEVAESGSKII